MSAEVYPLIARVAGLSADTLLPFASGLTADCERLVRLQEELQEARRSLAQHLHEAIGEASPTQRRLLLEIRRDAVRGRGLQRYAGKVRDAELPADAAGQIDDVIDLEEQVQQRRREFEEGFEAQRNRERHHLIEISKDFRFLRGLAHGSVVLTENLPRLTATPPDAYGRRERRLLESLYRYVTRAAVKLSPLSTLTAIGLGVAGTGFPKFRLLGSRPWRERTLICLRRYFLDQCCDLLTHSPPFKEKLGVLLNETTERLQRDIFRLLRPGRWQYDADAAVMKFQRPALVKVRLRGPLVEWLLEPGAVGRSYRHLIEEAARRCSDDPESETQRTIDELIRIGFLRFVWPWNADEFHLERRLLSYVESLAPDLQEIAEVLHRLIAVLDGYAESRSPSRDAAEVKQGVWQLRQAAARAAGVAWQVEDDPAERYFQEDVVLAPPNGTAVWGEIVHLPLSDVQRVLVSITPLVRLCNLGTLRFDFLHTLGAFVSSQWPGREEIGFLDAFESAHGLFQDYVRFEVARRTAPSLSAACFNPLELPALEELRQWRQQTFGRLSGCIEREGEHLRIRHRELSALLDEVPKPYAETRDFCAFVQPVGGASRQWVLNTCFEGAGRMGSRYTGAMDQRMRDVWTSYFMRHAVFWRDEERYELVDLFCPAGNTMNVHLAQTPRAIEISSLSTTPPTWHRLRLGDLRLRCPGVDQPPYVVDRDGNHLLPIHVGGLVFRYMPHLLKFLTMFGLGEFQFFFPSRPACYEEDVTVLDRLVIGDVVCLRKRWVCDPAPLRAELCGLGDAEAFVAVDRWRRSRTIGEQVFLIEPLALESKKPQHKPQYIDFRSPFSVALFRSAVSLDIPKLHMTEALPCPEAFPLDEAGVPWAVEFQLDSFGVPELACDEPAAGREAFMVTA